MIVEIVIVLLVVAVITVGIVLIVNTSEKIEKKKADQLKLQQEEKDKADYEVSLQQSGFRIAKSLHFNKNHFTIDIEKKLINIASHNLNRTFEYKDLVSFEMVEDGNVIANSTNAAVVGGLLFGVTGAVVGSTMRKQTNICTNMQLRISINDILNPSVAVILITDPGAIKNGVMYTQAFNFAKEICETLAVIKKQAKE